MIRAGFQVLCLLTVLAGLVPAAHAAEAQPPTVFDGAYQGLLVGGTMGLAIGYLFARQNGWDSSDDWKPLVYGAGVGAIAGSVFGLTLGIVDTAQDNPGRSGYVMRDGLCGAGLGAILGGIAGGLAAISSKDAEHVLLGGSIGVLSGAGLGMGVGFIEGFHKYSPSVAPVQHADGSVTFVPAVTGRF